MATWLDLGLITPVVNEWRSSQIASIGGQTFRVTFRNLGQNPPPYFRTYALISALYFSGERSRTIRIYPSIESRIVELPIPPDLIQAGNIVRYISVMKKLYYRIGRLNEPLWTVQIEDFVSDPNTDPANFTINLF